MRIDWLRWLIRNQVVAAFNSGVCCVSCAHQDYHTRLCDPAVPSPQTKDNTSSGKVMNKGMILRSYSYTSLSFGKTLSQAQFLEFPVTQMGCYFTGEVVLWCVIHKESLSMLKELEFYTDNYLCIVCLRKKNKKRCNRICLIYSIYFATVPKVA